MSIHSILTWYFCTVAVREIMTLEVFVLNELAYVFMVLSLHIFSLSINLPIIFWIDSFANKMEENSEMCPV